MTNGPTQSYADRLSHELTAFGGREGRRYSDFGTFYARNYKWPRLAEVTGCANAIEFYVNHFAERLRARPDGRVVSIGSGDAKLEIKVARRLRGLGLTEFGFDCLEISPERNTRARGHAKAAASSRACVSWSATSTNGDPSTVTAGSWRTTRCTMS